MTASWPAVVSGLAANRSDGGAILFVSARTEAAGQPISNEYSEHGEDVVRQILRHA